MDVDVAIGAVGDLARRDRAREPGGSAGVGRLEQLKLLGRGARCGNDRQRRLAPEPRRHVPVEISRLAVRPGHPREQPVGGEAGQGGQVGRQAGGVLVLLGARVQVQVHVGQRVPGDELDRGVGGRAAVATGEGAGERGHGDRDDQSDEGDEAQRDRQAPARVDVEREPEPARAASSRAREPCARARQPSDGADRAGEHAAAAPQPLAESIQQLPYGRQPGHHPRFSGFGTNLMMSGTPSSPYASRIRFSRWNAHSREIRRRSLTWIAKRGGRRPTCAA